MQFSFDPFLDALDESGRAQLLELGRTQRFRTGMTIFHEGDRSASVYLVRAGRVKVASLAPDGREVVLALRGPGSLVGELASLQVEPRRSASAVATTDCTVQVIRDLEFRQFVEQQPRALLALTRMLIARLHDADRRRVEQVVQGVSERVAGALVELAGAVPTGSATVDVEPALSQRELADVVGASRESVVRALAEFRRRGLIRTGRRSITLLDVETLRALAR